MPLPLPVPAPPAPCAPCDSAATDLRVAAYEACEEYGRRRDAGALVRTLRGELATLHRLPGARRSDAVYQFSILMKRVERTCGVHFCGLWNEVRRGGAGSAVRLLLLTRRPSLRARSARPGAASPTRQLRGRRRWRCGPPCPSR